MSRSRRIRVLERPRSAQVTAHGDLRLLCGINIGFLKLVKIVLSVGSACCHQVPQIANPPEHLVRRLYHFPGCGEHKLVPPVGAYPLAAGTRVRRIRRPGQLPGVDCVADGGVLADAEDSA